MRMTNILAATAFVVAASGCWQEAKATDQLDITVGLKTLPLLANKIASPAPVGIVFDPANGASKADADAIKAAIDGGLEGPGGVKLTGQMVAVSDLGKLSGAKIVILAAGVGKGSFDAIATASSGALTLSTDLDCVKSNKCVLGIVSKPAVEIYFSKAAADAAHIGFAAAFAMLAKPV